jgi:hypothetical protein
LNTIQWVFSGVGVLALVLLGRLCIFLWGRRSISTPQPVSEPSQISGLSSTVPLAKARFSKPTPDEITRQVESLPPFQQKNAEEAYRGLRVCWQALFRDIEDDVPANKDRGAENKKWIVNLKHYDPSIDYSNGDICCPGIDLERYPELKTLHKNELVIVTGTVAGVSYYRVLIYDAEFEFSGTRITSKRFHSA